MFKNEIRLTSLNEFCIKSLFQKDFTSRLPQTPEYNEPLLGISNCFTIHDLIRQVKLNPNYENKDVDYLTSYFQNILNSWIELNWVDCLDIEVEQHIKVTIYWCKYMNIDFQDPNTPYINRKTYSILSNSRGPQNNPNKRKASELLFQKKRPSVPNVSFVKPIKFFKEVDSKRSKAPANFVCPETYSFLQVKHELISLQRRLTKWNAFSIVIQEDKIRQMMDLQRKWQNHGELVLQEFFSIYQRKELNSFDASKPLTLVQFVKKLKLDLNWFNLDDDEEEEENKFEEL